MKRLLSVGAAGALVLGAGLVSAQPAQAATPPSYSVMLLKPLVAPPDGGALASGINNRGDVVGTSVSGQSTQSVVWPARSGIPVRVLAEEPGTSSAADISGDRTIVGYDQPGPGTTKSYWDEGSTTTWVETDDHEAQFRAISENGVATLNGDDLAYTATSASDITQLALPVGAVVTQAYGISDDGRLVAGFSQPEAGPDSQANPVVWADGVPRTLALPAGRTDGWASAVNNAGVAVGTVEGATGAAARWSASGTPSLLPMPAGSTGSQAVAINTAGVVAGNSDVGPLVWMDGQVLKLNDLVAGRSGYALESVTDINAAGQIVGYARMADGGALGFIATPTNAVNLYTTPGLHNYNGRQWNTNCGPYSQTTRCQTDIWSTQVKVINGKYTHVTGWNFNNLTYVASPRALWTGNPLGNTGTWTSNGRQWRTECDTPATGQNGCRSYIWSRIVVPAAKGGGTYSYTSTWGWVFNNIVHFG